MGLRGTPGGMAKWRAVEDGIDVRGGLIHSMQSNVEKASAKSFTRFLMGSSKVIHRLMRISKL